MTNMAFPFADRGTADLSPCRKYRYRLTRTLTGPGMPLVFVMLNPSTADASIDDPTIRRCIGFGDRLGRSGIHVINLFAFRTPYPEELRDAQRHGEDIVGPRGDQVLDAIPGTVICAWGPPKWPFVRERARKVAERITARRLPLFCLGTSKDGSPRHPLMLRNDATLTEWRIP